MQQQLIEKFTAAATGCGGIGTLFMGYMNENAAGIGAVCTIVSLAVYITVTVVNQRSRWRAEHATKELKR